MKNTLPHRLIFTLTLLAFTGLLSLFTGLFSGPIQAQNLFAPVAKVNDSTVTAYELSQRMAFLRLLRAPGDLRQTAIDQLINERLQIQTARQMGVRLTADQLAGGMAEFAARANLDTEKFLVAIAQGGVAAETFRDFVSAGLLWREIARARFRPQATISEAEIDRAAEQAQPATETRVLMSEIVLPAGNPETQRASALRAADLAKITDEADFATAARNFSAAATRHQGGKLEWIAASNLPPEVAARVVGLAPGQVTSPIEMPGGIALYLLHAKEETGGDAPAEVTLDFARYYIPGGQSRAALERAARISAEVDVCDDLYGIAKDQPEDVLERDQLTLAALPTDIAMELAKLDNNEISTALTRNNGETLMFLMLCGRSRIAADDVLSRASLRSQLRNQRLAALASGYLQELRANAHIELLAP